MRSKKKLNNKGFTLLEIVITVAIISILFGGVVTVFPQWMNQYLMLRQTAKATEVMDVVATAVRDEMVYSTDREWTEEGLKYVRDVRMGTIPVDTADCSVSYAPDETGGSGVITIEGRPQIFGTIFDDDFYTDMTIKLVLEEKERARGADGSMGKKFLQAQIEVFSAEGQRLASVTEAVAYYNP